MMKVFVMGNVGFIGFYIVRCLFEWGDSVVGIDNVNDYYDVILKEVWFSEF